MLIADWRIRKAAQAASRKRLAVPADVVKNLSTLSSNGANRVACACCKLIAAYCSARNVSATDKQGGEEVGVAVIESIALATVMSNRGSSGGMAAAAIGAVGMPIPQGNASERTMMR